MTCRPLREEPTIGTADRLQRLLDSVAVSRALATLIVLSVAGLTLQTVSGLPATMYQGLRVLEVFTIGVFSVEYVSRVWAAGSKPHYRGLTGRLRYAVTPMALLDLAAVAPAFIPAVGADLRFLRIPRLLRLLRVAKLTRYSPALSIIGRVVYRKRVELFVVGTLAALVVVIAGSLMYVIEAGVQPEQFSSIPAAMWWAVVTLTTVGYGDVYPVTVLGRTVGSLITVLGIGLIALPTAILGTEFLNELSKPALAVCPHCGRAPTGGDVEKEPVTAQGAAHG